MSLTYMLYATLPAKLNLFTKFKDPRSKNMEALQYIMYFRFMDDVMFSCNGLYGGVTLPQQLCSHCSIVQ